MSDNNMNNVIALKNKGKEKRLVEMLDKTISKYTIGEVRNIINESKYLKNKNYTNSEIFNIIEKHYNSKPEGLSISKKKLKNQIRKIKNM